MESRLPVKMLINAFLLSVLVCGILGQKLVITHAPSYVTFQEQEQPLQTSEVTKVISNTLGVPSQSDMSWKGLLHGSMFKRPKANVLVTVVTTEGTPDLKLNSQMEFPVSQDTPMVDIPELMTSLQGTFLDKNPLMLDAAVDNNMFDVHSEFDVFRKLSNSLRRMSDRLLDLDSVAQNHNTGTLNGSIPTDLSLMGELQLIQDVLGTVRADGGKMVETKTPDMYSFTVKGLKDVVDTHGAGSTQAADASQFVTDFLHQMTDQFRTLYKNNVVVEILMVRPGEGLVRKTRSLMAEDASGPSVISKSPYNVALDYDENYPVAFNIILWLMILLAIAIYAIAYSIWNMDPGRDSIIYRMTTTRLKRD